MIIVTTVKMNEKMETMIKLIKNSDVNFVTHIRPI